MEIRKMVLQLPEATRIIESAIAKALELNVEITVAICNRDGHLIAFNRMDGVSLAEANREAIGKAIVSAAWGLPSEQPQGVAHHIPQDLVYAEGAPAIRRRGGLPILRHGQVEGACGVSGAGDGEVEEECARAGIAAL
jgi:glc operon protein GlcG